MFELNDYIVYGGKGVCVVEEITTPKIGGIDTSKEYYVLQPLNSKGSKIYTPVDNEKVLMRKIITKDDALKLIDDIPNIGMIWVEEDKRREETYKQAVNKHDCRELIKIIKTLYVRKQDCISKEKKITNTDKCYLKIAEEYLFGEMSVALEIPIDKVEAFIAQRVDTVTS